jgi:signal transduction histidine kinase
LIVPGRRRGSSHLRTTLDRVLIHDIKNMGFRLQMLRSNLDTHYGDPDFRRSVQELLASTIDRLDGIVGRWSGEQDHLLIKVALDVNGLLRDIVGTATRRGARLHSAEAARLPVLSLALGAVPQIWGDPYFLRDAFSSLIDNALEAAGPAGKVLIRTFSSRLRPGSRTRPRTAVEIIDNGPGMSPEFVRDRLFRPFQTTKSDGVGLGLFTASQIVRHHGGTIRVKSGSGEGTVVRLTFPVLEAAS